MVQDLNLVSQLEYEMQPLQKQPVRLSKLLRSLVAELLNEGIDEKYSIEVNVSNEAETVEIAGDARLISRAIRNLLHNSINHNPEGCEIFLLLDCSDQYVTITVTDTGIGISEEKMRELQEIPHYMNSTDERLDLRHGLGLILVRQIADAHGGSVQFDSNYKKGCRVILSLRR